jgi:hypothetical protein
MCLWFEFEANRKSKNLVKGRLLTNQPFGVLTLFQSNYLFGFPMWKVVYSAYLVAKKAWKFWSKLRFMDFWDLVI